MLADLPQLKTALGSSVPIEWSKGMTFDPATSSEIVEDTFTAGTMSVVYGEPGSGKTTVTGDLSFRMPRGAEWLGKRLVKGTVLYLAAESPHSIRRRHEAYRRTHGEIGNFAMIASSLNLLDPSADVDRLVDTVLALPVSVQMIVIDTLARTMVGANENAGEDMGRVVAGGDYIRTRTGAHVCWVHHCGKDRAQGARGHSSLRAAVDTEIEVTAEGGLHHLVVTKQRDLGSNGMKLSARFVPIELGVNQWGKPITACVVEHVPPPSAHMQAVIRRGEIEHAETVVLAGYRALLAQGIQPTDKANSPDYLPRQILSKCLGNGTDQATLTAGMNRLMTRGLLKRDVVGRYASNRAPRHGLVLVEECTK